MFSLCITGIFTQVPFSTVFPATRIPNWFKHHRKGHTIRIKASPNWYSNNFLGFSVSAVMYIGNSSKLEVVTSMIMIGIIPAVMIVMREILVEVSFLISFNIMQWTEAPKKPQVEEACRKM